MNPKRVQRFFFLGIVAISLHFTTLLTIDSLNYLSLKEKAPVRVSEWEIFPKGSRYAIRAYYEFSFQKKTFSGNYTFPPPYYLNEKSAYSSLKNLAKADQTVWLNPSNPQKNALEKSYPLGNLLKTIICVSAVIYFFYLGKISLRV